MAEQPEMTGQTDPATRANDSGRVGYGTIANALRRVSVQSAFGDPVTQGDHTVIPVARTSINYGFGARRGRASDEEDTGTGSGGGRVRSNGIGYIELTPGNARFVPTVDRSTILTTIGTFAGLAAILTMPRLLRQRR